jgi:hypothetical protein
VILAYSAIKSIFAFEASNLVAATSTVDNVFDRKIQDDFGIFAVGLN